MADNYKRLLKTGVLLYIEFDKGDPNDLTEIVENHVNELSFIKETTVFGPLVLTH